MLSGKKSLLLFLKRNEIQVRNIFVHQAEEENLLMLVQYSQVLYLCFVLVFSGKQFQRNSTEVQVLFIGTSWNGWKPDSLENSGRNE